MEAFALYLFKSVVWIAGFTLIFILFLKNERFFLLNRIYLIAGILTSFLFPLISIHYTVVVPIVANIPARSVISGIQIEHHPLIPDIKTILSVLYFIGVGFVVWLAVRQGRSVFRAIKKSEVISLRPVKLIKTPEYTSAFSFFSYVFVNPSVTDIETKEIMIHELVHIRQKHWFDLLLVELLRMMQWFNPLVWIYVRFIRQNHEYLADEVALQQTSDPAIYKAVLLNQIVGAPVISLSNSFNYSPNKKRFYMMKNIITSPYRKMKVLLILPVFAFVLFAFAKPDYKFKYADQNLSGMISGADSTKHKKGIPPPPPLEPASLDGKGVPAPPPPAPVNLLPPPPPGIKSDSVKKPLVIMDGVIKDVDLNTVEPETIESVTVLKDKNAIDKYGDKAKNGAVEVTTKISSKVQIKSEKGAQPLIVVDGVVSKDTLNSIEPETIENVSVLKDTAAVVKYGEKGKNGVVEISIKKDVQVNKEEKATEPVKVVKEVSVVKEVPVVKYDVADKKAPVRK